MQCLVAQSCPTLGDPVDYSLPCSSVLGILQAGILEWVALSFSRGPSQPRDRTGVSCIPGRFSTNWATREENQSITAKFFFLITNILKSKREDKWLGAEQVHFCMWFPRSTNNIHCTFLKQLIVFCQLKYLRQMSSTDQHNTLQHYVWKTRQ